MFCATWDGSFTPRVVWRRNLSPYHSSIAVTAFNSSPVAGFEPATLRLQCSYNDTMSYVINRTWCLKQRWLQVNGHASFHLHMLHWTVRNRKGAKNSKFKIYVSSGIRIHARHSMTVQSALWTTQSRGFNDELCIKVLQDNGTQINKNHYVTTSANLIMATCVLELSECETKSTFLISI